MVIYFQDYWLSYAYKKLVGLKVLDTTSSSSTLYFRGRGPSNANTFRVYAHCTQPRCVDDDDNEDEDDDDDEIMIMGIMAMMMLC